VNFSFTGIDLLRIESTSLDSIPVDNLFTITAVPVPAAFWLFASGLLAMTGTARRKA